MSIFPEKDKHGRLTGYFIVKVMSQGTLRTARTTDGKRAILIERELKQGGIIMGPPDPPVVEVPPTLTLGKLMLMARVVYKGTKDERRSLARMEAACTRLGLDKPIGEIRTKQLDLLAHELRQEGMNPKTINRYLAPISKVLTWAVSQDLLPSRPVIPRQREGEGRLVFLTEQQCVDLLAWLRGHDLPDVALVTEVLMVSGFRITELLSRKSEHLRSGWLHLDAGETKNDKARAVYLQEPLGSSLADLMASGLPPYQKILISLSEASLDLGLPHVTPHVLRHTTASRLDALGFSTAQIQEYLGHRHIGTTLKYAHVTRETVRKASEALALLQTNLPTNPQTTCITDGIQPERKSNENSGSGGLARTRTGIEGFAVQESKRENEPKD
ncbi:MAG: tyrosine-type recombinase/integrase [Thiothrix sp.]|uniref:tyrosine-type recombinase/integrase n=1 Tax=Thiothrix sp. TaxID=1032 RepID=UPI00261712F2|nr:tyrosine-type recombinase/integrase [Thiothrix sp.]MDD5395287.1 tyrosine-type recombinase/integrase [Thiothrix sp.]